MLIVTLTELSWWWPGDTLQTFRFAGELLPLQAASSAAAVTTATSATPPAVATDTGGDGGGDVLGRIINIIRFLGRLMTFLNGGGGREQVCPHRIFNVS